MNLKKLLAKDPGELTAAEKEFLRENVESLSDEQREAFKAVLSKDAVDGIDEDKLMELLEKHADEIFNGRVDKIADDVAKKFMTKAMEQRAKVLGGGKVNNNPKADENTRKFFKALMSRDTVALKAFSTDDTPDTDGNAGFTIPSELRAEVLRIAQVGYGVAREEMFYLPFSGPGNKRVIPALGTSVSVKWTDEGGKKKSTGAKFSVVTQTLNKLAAIVPFTEEILEDTAIDLTGLVATLIVEATSKEEDIQFFTGTGSPWTGVLNNSDVNPVTQASGDVNQVTVDDLIDMEDKTPAGALPGSKYYFHRSILSVLRKLKDKNGNYILVPAANGQPATLNGYPYRVCEAFPAVGDVGTGDAYILFGNLRQGAVYGDKQQIRVQMLTEATITDTDGSTAINLAEQDMVAMRFVKRVGYVVALPEALTVLKAAAHES